MWAWSKWALVGLVLCASCSCGDGGGPKDGGNDDGGDGAVVRDGGRDARVPDAAPDAARPDDPGWVALPGLPEGCVVERATHPELVFQMRWRPCEGIAGCEELDGATVFDDFGTFDEGEGYLWGATSSAAVGPSRASASRARWSWPSTALVP